MSENLVRKVGEVLNNTPIYTEDELADALGEMPRDVGLIEPESQDWGGWVIYLCEQMEAGAKRLVMRTEFEQMVKHSSKEISENNSNCLSDPPQDALATKAPYSS
jgi:hypothetical protein